MEKLKAFGNTIREMLRPFSRLLRKSSFVGMALFCFLLRVFMRQPVGSFIALIIGSAWIWIHVPSIRGFITNICKSIVASSESLDNNN